MIDWSATAVAASGDAPRLPQFLPLLQAQPGTMYLRVICSGTARHALVDRAGQCGARFLSVSSLLGNISSGLLSHAFPVLLRCPVRVVSPWCADLMQAGIQPFHLAGPGS